MHLFDPDLSIKDNYLNGDDIEFAAWQLAGHDHREEHRDSGQSPQRTAWLHSERIEILRSALANGELLALGILNDDPLLEISRIPANLFLLSKLRIDGDRSIVAGLKWEFADVRVCRANAVAPYQAVESKSTGRPNHLPVIMDAWNALKANMPGFLELDKSTQNRDIQDIAAKLFPAKFPGNSKIGDSTIRRHRRDNPELFT